MVIKMEAQMEKERALEESKEVEVVKTGSSTLGLTFSKATNQEKKNLRPIGNPGMIKTG